MSRSRKIALISVFAVVCAPAAMAQASIPNPIEIPDAVPDSPFGPIHSFQMEGSIIDEIDGVASGNHENLTPVEGYVGGAMHFDGTSFAEVPIGVSPRDHPNMTFIAMIKLDPLPDNAEDLLAVPTSGYIFTDGDSYINLGNQKKDSAFLSAYSAGALVYESTLHAAPHGVWHMVAMTRKVEKRTTDDGELLDHIILNLYVDGRMQEAVEVFEDKPTEPKFMLAARSAGYSQKFRGAIDQVSFYNRALSKEDLDKIRGVLRSAARGPIQPVAQNETGSNTGNGDNTTDNPKDRVAKDPVGLPNTNIEQEIKLPPGSPGTVPPVLFPGDQFEEDDEEQFPGDQFEKENEENTAAIKPIFTPVFTPSISDDGEAAGVPVDLGAIRDAAGLPSGSSTVAEGIERANDRKRALDAAARDAAVRQAGIDNSKARDIATPPIADPTAQSGGVRTPVLIDEAVRQAGIDNSKTIDIADPGFTPPIAREDDLKQITGTEEGQDMLKTADWRLVGVVKRSKMELYPGDELTMTIRVKKDDPANKIPEVRLIVRHNIGVGGGYYTGMQIDYLPFVGNLRVMTNDQKPTASRDIPVTIKVPTDLGFPDGASTTNLRLVAEIAGKEARVLRDFIPDNHQQEIVLRINKPAAEEDTNNHPNSEGATKSASFKVDLSNKTLTDISGVGYSDNSVDVMTFDGRGALLGFIKIGERGDRPCRVAIDDGVDRGGDPGQALNRCARPVRDSEEFRISPHRAITKLTVCHSGNSNIRVKGVRVETRPILEDGSLGDEVRHNNDLQQPNCQGLQNTVSCPAGQVAGGIQASFLSNSDRGSDELNGIGLVCGDIIVPAK